MMRFLFCVFLAVSLLVLGCAGFCQSAKDDFLSSNPNSNGWSFGYLDENGVFVLYNTPFFVSENVAGWCADDCPGLWGDVTINFSNEAFDKFGVSWNSSQLVVNPSLNGREVVVRFESPTSANAKVIGKLSEATSSDGKTTMRVEKNGALLLEQKSSGRMVSKETSAPENGKALNNEAVSDSAIIDISSTTLLSKGSTIDFIFTRDSLSSGHVSLDLSIDLGGESYSFNPKKLIMASAEVTK